MSNKLPLPSILSFRRALEVTDATMHSIIGSKEEAIGAFLHGQRPAKSHDIAAKSTGDAISEGEENAGNLVFGYKAKLPTTSGVLRIRTNIAVLPIREVCEATNDTAWAVLLPALLDKVYNSPALEFVAKGIAYNVLSGAWTWRNRDVAREIAISVTVKRPKKGDETVSVKDSRTWPKFGVSTPAQHANGDKDPLNKYPEVTTLAKFIIEGLKGSPLQLNVVADLSLLPGQECWPSQLYLPKKRTEGMAKIGKEFYSFGGTQTVPGPVEAVGMTAEKVSNALRTLDRFHGNTDYSNTVLAFESNGTSLQYSRHLRARGKRIYEILPSAAADFASLKEDDVIFLTGWLIRGGLVSNVEETEAEVDKKAKKASKAV